MVVLELIAERGNEGGEIYYIKAVETKVLIMDIKFVYLLRASEISSLMHPTTRGDMV